MARHTFRPALSIAAALALAAIALPAAAQAKTTSIHLVLRGKLQGAGAAGPATGAPCGKGSFVSRVLVPTVNYTVRCGHDTFRLTATTTLDGSSVTGTWKTVSGTGRFRHMRGHGTLTGSLQPGKPFILVGRVHGL